MKKRNILLPVLLFTMSSCAKEPIEGYFNNYFACSGIVRLYDGSQYDINELKKTYSKLDRLTDNYQGRDITNVYTINQSEKEVEIDPILYNILEASFNLKDELTYFNPLCGSLAKKWKDALGNDTTLILEEINEELEKINSSSLEFLGNNKVRLIGEAEIDLGACAKGYALDMSYDYFVSHNIKQYLVNCGTSSILLGEKDSEDGLYTIALNNLNNAYIKAKNIFISTSSVSRQGKIIEGVQYSHIVNPISGSAVNVHDAVIVLSNNGLLGDILSTALMNNTIQEIKYIENSKNVKCLVIKDNNIEYKNEAIEIIYG